MTDYNDKLNKQILDKMLSGKGIKPRISELARELSNPRSTVDLRVRLLENEDIIEGYKPIINWEKLGFDIQGYVGVSCAEDTVERLLGAMMEEDSVVRVWELTTGTFNLLSKCRFQNYEEMKDLRETIRENDGVQNADVWLIGTCHKEE